MVEEQDTNTVDKEQLSSILKDLDSDSEEESKEVAKNNYDLKNIIAEEDSDSDVDIKKEATDASVTKENTIEVSPEAKEPDKDSYKAELEGILNESDEEDIQPEQPVELPLSKAVVKENVKEKQPHPLEIVETYENSVLTDIELGTYLKAEIKSSDLNSIRRMSYQVYKKIGDKLNGVIDATKYSGRQTCIKVI